MTIVLGIDPGASTGFALYVDGVLQSLSTGAPSDVHGVIALHSPALVVFEDSRLTSPTWSRGVSKQAMLKIARNVGMVDGCCAMVMQACADLSIPCRGISPRHKGRKLDAPSFAAVTGWTRRCNQHERDAAMVAWPYRHTRIAETA